MDMVKLFHSIRQMIPALVGLFFVFFSVIPFSFSPATKIYVPLILIVIYYFAIFRPSVLNDITVFFLGLLTDFLLDAPIGFHAFFYVLLFFLTNLNRAFLLNLSFNALWIIFVAVLFCFDTLTYLSISLLSGTFLYPVDLFIQFFLLVFFYPLIMAFCGWLNIRLGGYE